MAGKFKVKRVTNLHSAVEGQEIPESDFCELLPNGDFVQLEYIRPDEDDKSEKYQVKPGVWTIKHNSMLGFYLEQTSFVKDDILSEFVNTQDVTKRVDTFFNRLHIYAKYGIEVPRYNILLHGPPGTGKSTSISQIVTNYKEKAAIIVWPTDRFEPYDIKNFIKTFEYEAGVERLIMIVEDIGGVESEDRRVTSDSSLLSLLDNNEKTFTIPTCMLATTNFPQMLLGNLTNRPGRFDLIHKVGAPTAEQRVALLNFFTKNSASQEAIDLFKSKETDGFSIAHVRHIVIQADLYDISLIDMTKQVLKDIQNYLKEYKDSQGKMGFYE